jgi:hypothetical protein
VNREECQRKERSGVRRTWLRSRSRTIRLCQKWVEEGEEDGEALRAVPSSSFLLGRYEGRRDCAGGGEGVVVDGIGVQVDWESAGECEHAASY